jgi:hydrogenase maturation protease
MSSAPEAPVVIGIGNRWRGDDAAGLEVAGELRRRGIPALDAEGEPVALMELWEGRPAAILVDAVRSGAAPGTLHRHDASHAPLPAASQTASSHLLGVGEAIELARALGRLPPRVAFIGIEGADFASGAELSPPVAAAIDGAVAEVELTLGRLLPAE